MPSSGREIETNGVVPLDQKWKPCTEADRFNPPQKAGFLRDCVEQSHLLSLDTHPLLERNKLLSYVRLEFLDLCYIEIHTYLDVLRVYKCNSPSLINKFTCSSL